MASPVSWRSAEAPSWLCLRFPCAMAWSRASTPWRIHASWLRSGGCSRRRGSGLSFGVCEAGLLVDADQISRRVAEGCDNLSAMRVNFLHDFATSRPDCFDRLGSARHHDVDHRPGLRCDGPPQDPRPTHLVDGVVEGRRTITSLAGLPPESATIELGRLLDISRWDLDVANLAGSVCGRLNRCTHDYVQILNEVLLEANARR